MQRQWHEPTENIINCKFIDPYSNYMKLLHPFTAIFPNCTPMSTNCRKNYQALHVDVQPRRKWRKNVSTIEIRSLDMQRMRVEKKTIQSWSSHNAHESSVPYQCQWDRWCDQTRCQMVKRELVTAGWSLCWSLWTIQYEYKVEHYGLIKCWFNI